MKAKKSKKADLESRKNQFLQLGLILSLAFTLVAFEWSDGNFSKVSASGVLSYDLTPEYVTYVEFESDSKRIVKPEPTRSELIEDVIVSDDLIKSESEQKEEFDEIDESEFSEMEEVDEIKYEKITVKKSETTTVGSGFVFSNGYLPHYKNCSKYSGNEMMDCVNEEIKYNLQNELKLPPSLYHTGSKLVVATFTIDEFGKVSEIFIHKENKYEQDLIDEVKRALFAMPVMIPGSQGDNPIRVRFTLPINLSIQ